MTAITFHDLADLVASLTTPPIGVWWQGNTANDAASEWSIQTATCADFDRLAKRLPTSPSRRWLNGDQKRTTTGPTTRTHAVEGNGWIKHVCFGCPDEPEAAAMTTIVIRLHPSEVLNANQRLHWAEKARLTASLRARATIAWRQAGSPQMSRARCTLTVDYPNRRRREVDNLQPTWKPLIDGMVNPGVRGLLPDDSDDYLRGPHAEPGDITPGFFTFTFRFDELP